MKWICHSVVLVMLAVASMSCRDNTPQEPQVVSWPNAVQIIRSGRLHSGSQNHDQTVDLWTKDGSWYRTTEPKLDDVYKILKEIYPKGYPPGGFPTE